MKLRWFLPGISLSLWLASGGALGTVSQDPQPGAGQAPPDDDSAPARQHVSRGQWEGRGRPVFGKIAAISDDLLEVAQPDGTRVSLKLTAATEFRKDRQPAKAADFKVGDPVVVRTNQPDGTGDTAVMIASGQFMMRAGPGGQGSGGRGMFGTLGKDFVLGEVKAVDPPKLTVQRPDNVTQTLELNENTSLQRGRDSITMAEIQAGDHVMARGAVENGVFVPKTLRVIAPEQWKRMQEMMQGIGANQAPQSSPPPSQPKPPEPRN